MGMGVLAARIGKIMTRREILLSCLAAAIPLAGDTAPTLERGPDRWETDETGVRQITQTFVMRQSGDRLPDLRSVLPSVPPGWVVIRLSITLNAAGTTIACLRVLREMRGI